METASVKQAQPRFLTAGNMVLIALFAAVLAILSQFSIPTPTNVPLTLQTFAVALTGVVLGWQLGLSATALFILLGSIGVPVFASFSGGLHVVLGYSGGFIWGFLIMAALCGLGSSLPHKAAGYALGILGLVLCHLLGILQFMAVARHGFAESFLLVSAPYLIKDIVSVILAYIVGNLIRRRLIRAGVFRG